MRTTILRGVVYSWRRLTAPLSCHIFLSVCHRLFDTVHPTLNSRRSELYWEPTILPGLTCPNQMSCFLWVLSIRLLVALKGSYVRIFVFGLRIFFAFSHMSKFGFKQFEQCNPSSLHHRIIASNFFYQLWLQRIDQ